MSDRAYINAMNGIGTEGAEVRIDFAVHYYNEVNHTVHPANLSVNVNPSLSIAQAKAVVRDKIIAEAPSCGCTITQVDIVSLSDVL